MAMTVIKQPADSDTDWKNILARGLGRGLIKRDASEMKGIEQMLRREDKALEGKKDRESREKNLTKKLESDKLLRDLIIKGQKEITGIKGDIQKAVTASQVKGRSDVAGGHDKTALDVQGKRDDAAMLRAKLGVGSSERIAGMNIGGRQNVADTRAGSASLVAQINEGASRYGADRRLEGQKYGVDQKAAIAKKQRDHEMSMLGDKLTTQEYVHQLDRVTKKELGVMNRDVTLLGLQIKESEKRSQKYSLYQKWVEKTLAQVTDPDVLAESPQLYENFKYSAWLIANDQGFEQPEFEEATGWVHNLRKMAGGAGKAPKLRQPRRMGVDMTGGGMFPNKPQGGPAGFTVDD